LAPSGAGLLKVKVFWRQKAQVISRLKISSVIVKCNIGTQTIAQIVQHLQFHYTGAVALSNTQPFFAAMVLIPILLLELYYKTFYFCN
jgi:hypothetical protein